MFEDQENLRQEERMGVWKRSQVTPNIVQDRCRLSHLKANTDFIVLHFIIVRSQDRIAYTFQVSSYYTGM